MTLVSGWCLDEILYRDLDQHHYAQQLHDKCPIPHCTCPNHDHR